MFPLSSARERMLAREREVGMKVVNAQKRKKRRKGQKHKKKSKEEIYLSPASFSRSLSRARSLALYIYVVICMLTRHKFVDKLGAKNCRKYIFVDPDDDGRSIDLVKKTDSRRMYCVSHATRHQVIGKTNDDLSRFSLARFEVTREYFVILSVSCLECRD